MNKANKIKYNEYESRLDEYMESFARETDGIVIPEDKMDKISDVFGAVANIPSEYVLAEYLTKSCSVSIDINMGNNILVNILVPLDNNEDMKAYFCVSRDKILEAINVGNLNGVIESLIKYNTFLNEENGQKS